MPYATKQDRSDIGQTFSEPHNLWFNAEGEVICSTSCTFRAKKISVIHVDAGAARSAAGNRAQRTLANGTRVWLGSAKCGVHGRGRYGWQDTYITPPDLTGDIEKDLDIAVAAYEAFIAKQQARDDAQTRDYIEMLTTTARYTEADFRIVVTDVHEGTNWIIEGPTYSDGFKAVSFVALANDHGVWNVSINPYTMVTGYGRSNPSFNRILARVLVKASDLADERNREAGHLKP